MKKVFMIFFIFMVYNSLLLAQHYITLGLGFTGLFFNSEDLDRLVIVEQKGKLEILIKLYRD